VVQAQQGPPNLQVISPQDMSVETVFFLLLGGVLAITAASEGND
jgi:hypothetical protein